MRCVLGVACALVIVAGSAAAQVLPPSAEPGRIEQRFAPTPVPQSRPEVQLPAPEAAPPPAQAASVVFDLSGVVIEGATAYPPAAFAALYEPLLGRTVTLADIYTLRDAITAKYRDDGFALSQAVIPAQTIRAGLVTIRVVEGYISDVRFEGDLPPDRLGLLQAYADKIKAARPVRMDDLERHVLLINDLPGLAARTVLKPADYQPGGTVLTIVIERRRASGGVTLDNRGTREVGRYQLDVAGEAYDLSGTFDKTSLRYVTVTDWRELKMFDLAESLPVDTEGTVLTLGARRNWSFPGGATKSLDVRSLNTTGRIAVSHPFIRSRAESLRADAGFTLRNSSSDATSGDLSEDRLRVVNAGVSYDFADATGAASLVQFTIAQGIPGLGASDQSSRLLTRAGGRVDFTKLSMSLQRTQPLAEEISLVAAADAQWAPHRLLSSEEFGVGGSQYGRAYDPSEITGDMGAAARVELQYTPAPVMEWFGYHQLYGFWDIGAVRNYEAGPTHGWRDLSSAGVGLRFAVAQTLFASVEVAKPLTRVVAAEGDHDWRPFFSVSTRF